LSLSGLSLGICFEFDAEATRVNGGVSSKSQGSHRRIRFLHCADGDVPVAYCFFVIEHGRRRTLHFNVTRHPKAEWVIQQLREAFPEAGLYRYVVFDRDSTFNNEVVTFLKATGLEPKRTSVRAPWQNGIAERWVGSCRREMLDHVIALNEPHLRRLIRDCVNYHHADRIHNGLSKDTPTRRPIDPKPLRKQP
jgi:putative transposase